MKKIIMALSLVLASSVALALPAPKDIEAAVKAGQLSQAETMLHEVIKEKPASAKAHYELGQVLAREGKNQEARKELLEAQRLDPSLKFASDPQRFRDLLNRIPVGTPAAPVARSVDATRPVAPAPAPVQASFPWIYVVLGGAALVIVWLLMSRRRAAAAPAPVGAAASGGGAPGGYGSYGPGYGPGYGAPQTPASGIGGAVLGGLAGMAAGYGLSKILEGNEPHEPQARNAAADNDFIPIGSDGGGAPDYGSFDAGSGGGDSWDGGDSSSSSGDDNW
ncbi:MAG: tetratricopeptide repeat protein [Rhodocyclaceae bacterium]|nr:tetratricopeptide repeat protein [Rhodocyclaceae bacterium]